MTLGIHAVYPSRKHLPIKTRRLVDFPGGGVCTAGVERPR